MIKWFATSLLIGLSYHSTITFGATNLADAPIFSTNNVPGNVALVISAEFPTALGSAYTTAYSSITDYIGYFDFKKCYVYNIDADVNKQYFRPSGAATVTHTCVAKWSGNYLNWALTQTVDPLRYALTGGYRSVDEVGLTVLEKAWASGQGGTVLTQIILANVNTVTPNNWTRSRIRIAGLGNKFYISNGGLNDSGGIVTPANPVIKPTDVQPSDLTGNRVYEFFARVKVCESAANIEANCQIYGGNYKPEGLIQKNATKLNFGAFGYLNDSNLQRDGGVLRAKMAALGPVKTDPGSVNVINPTPEWNASTGIFLTNPDAASATASGVSNSGVINYLNKFGLNTPGYKTFDPVGELYYTAIRYFKNQGNVASYISGATVAQRDGFPVINFTEGNAADDPIKYSCQANFVIGIGDTNTWADGNLPGALANIRGSEPALPPEVASDVSVNLRTATNKVGELQGLNGFGNLGERYTPTSGTKNTSFLMAGLAYDSHTKDMRPTKFLPTTGPKTEFQTLDTYWLDVLENGDYANNGGTGMRNQFWLTAKYGGFNVPNNYSPYTATIAPSQLSWDADNNGDPDNYFRANNPSLMISSLTKAFADIVKKVEGSSKAFSVKSATINAGDFSFATSYKGDDWSGDVTANSISVSGGNISETFAWSAADKLTTQAAGTGWNTARFIATSTCVAGLNGAKTCMGVPFRPASLTAAMISNLGSGYINVVNYLRGDKTNEGTFRPRTNLLGDIVGSKVIAIGAPAAPYSDSFNPGYSAFKTAKSTRTTVAYVGANDGMLHAFKGVAGGGQELFAYVPNALFAGANGVPTDTGLITLSQPAYSHRFFVDATPTVTDIDFGNVAGINNEAAVASTPDWRSVLIGGLGKGGKSYYAIDVTNSDSLSNENNLKSAVLWEFTNERMGYTYDAPLVVKTTKYGWVVIFTSGYANDDGKGYIFIVNARTGKLIQSITTNTGSISSEAGLAHVNAFTADARSFLIDAVYGGDLLGNVWRFDLTGTPIVYPAPEKIASLVSPSNLPQPITTAPVIEIDRATSKRYVFVGTGRLLADTDILSSQQQSFYAILDGTRSAFFNTATLPSAIGGYPITRSDMNNNTATIGTGVGLNPALSAGWYVDLDLVTTNGVTTGSRINVEIASSAGQVGFISNLTQGDACSPTGSNQLYVLEYGTGRTALPNGFLNFAGTGLGTSVSFAKIAGTSTVKVNVSDDKGKNSTFDTNSSTITGFKPLNWRELPNVE